MHKNLYKYQKLGCTWKLNTEKSVWFVKMSTICCNSCELRFAKWRYRYYGDWKEWKFCINCCKMHQTSPENGREQSHPREDLYPAHQDFPVCYTRFKIFILNSYAHKPCTYRLGQVKPVTAVTSFVHHWSQWPGMMAELSTFVKNVVAYKSILVWRWPPNKIFCATCSEHWDSQE